MTTALYEWIAFTAGLPAGMEPAPQRALPIAPARWLLVDPDPADLDACAASAAADAGALIDVSGRWSRVALDDPWPLRAGIALDLVLRGREAAAAWIFDCPVLLARRGDGIDCWVESSYSASFAAMLERVRTAGRPDTESICAASANVRRGPRGRGGVSSA
jgi:sarcosine oxidase gamma subunit